MLRVFSSYIYFFLLSLFWVLVFLAVFYGEHVFLNTNIVLFYTVLLLPFYAYIWEETRKRKILKWITISKTEYIKYTVLLLIMLGLWKYGLNTIDIVFVVLLCSSILWNLSEKAFFLWAIVFFVYVPIYLLIEDKEFAQEIQMYAYYLLMIWIIAQIRKILFSKKYIWRK